LRALLFEALRSAVMSRASRARSSSLTRVRQAAARVFGYGDSPALEDKLLFGGARSPPSGHTESATSSQGLQKPPLPAQRSPAQRPPAFPNLDKLSAGSEQATAGERQAAACSSKPPLAGLGPSGRRPRASSSGGIARGTGGYPSRGGNAARRCTSPAALRRLWRPAAASDEPSEPSAPVRDGFEEFFGYGEGAESSTSELPSLLQETRVQSPVDKHSQSAPKTDIVTLTQEIEKVSQAQASHPQVMDATEASLSMIRSAIEDRKVLLKEKRGKEFDEICAEIQQLKWQQTRLAGALWQGQCQDGGEDGHMEMQLKGWMSTS